MQQENKVPVFEDEIDLRQIIRTLLRYKWFIIATTFLMALAGFAYSQLTYKEQYQAPAILVITKPIFNSNLDARVETSPQQPEARVLIDLISADDLLLSVYQEAQLHTETGRESVESFSVFRTRFEAQLVGTSQVRLLASHSDPVQAAALAELWAEKAAQRLNSLYGLDRTSLEQLAVEKEAARQSWDEAEAALLAYLPNSQLESSAAQLEAEKASLARSVEKISRIDLIVSDVLFMESRLRGADEDAKITLEDILSLIALQQHAVDGSGLFQIQITAPELLTDEYSTGMARDRLAALAQSLQVQKSEIQNQIFELETRIAERSTEVEEERYRVAELTVQRDLARRAYEALVGQEQSVLLAGSQNDQMVRQAGEVIPPQTPEGGKIGLRTAVSAAAGLFASAAWVLLLNWWKSPDEEVFAENDQVKAVSLGD